MTINCQSEHCLPQDFESEAVVESQARPGVRFRIARITFRRRLELMRRVRDLARRDRQRASLAAKLRHARQAEAAAIALDDDVALLARWLRQ